MLLRWLVVLGVVAGVLSLQQAPARACSCESLPAESMLEISDGAFIGRLVAVAEPGEALDDVAYTFEVDEWIKGRVAPGFVDVMSAADGDACGFGLREGDEVAVFVSVRGDRITGGLCGTMNASQVRATVRPPALSDGPGVYLSVGFEPPSYLLGADGGVVGRLPSSVDDLGSRMHTPCGGSVIAELRADEVRLIDVSTSAVIEAVPVQPSLREIACAGDRLVGIERDRNGVIDLRTRETLSQPVARRASIALRGESLIVQGAADDHDPRGWWVTDLGTGERRRIADAVDTGRVESVDVSPSGERIAYTLAQGNRALVDVIVVAVDDGATVTRSVVTHIASVRWLDDEQVFVGTDSGGFPETEGSFLASGEDLATVVQYDEELNWPVALEGDRLVGTAGGLILWMPMAGGAAEVLNELPAPHQLVRLPEPVEVAPVTGIFDEPIDTPIASPRLEAVVTISETPPTPTAAAPEPSVAPEEPTSAPPTEASVSDSVEEAAAAPMDTGDGSSVPWTFVAGLVALGVAGVSAVAWRRWR